MATRYSVFTTLTLALGASIGLQAQPESPVSACTINEGAGVEITFDDTKNCAAAPGELAGLAAIGFHSGANQWSNVVEWDKAGAMNAMAVDDSTFRVTIDTLASYYGTTDAIENVFMVFNQGPADAANPWSSEGKADDGSGACADISIVMADLPACSSVSTSEPLPGALALAPNPAYGVTRLTIDNARGLAHVIEVRDFSGRSLRTVREFRGETFELVTADLTQGLYLVTVTDELGRASTSRLAVR